jgi:hypothetical protein
MRILIMRVSPGLVGCVASDFLALAFSPNCSTMASHFEAVLEAYTKFMFHLSYTSGFHEAVQKLNITLVGPSHILLDKSNNQDISH